MKGGAVATAPLQMTGVSDSNGIVTESCIHQLSGGCRASLKSYAPGEADVFHTRQQHTIKVAQVGRRLAQKCVQEQAKFSAQLGNIAAKGNKDAVRRKVQLVSY
jgi:hypothetical protein